LTSREAAVTSVAPAWEISQDLGKSAVILGSWEKNSKFGDSLGNYIGKFLFKNIQRLTTFKF